MIVTATISLDNAWLRVDRDRPGAARAGSMPIAERGPRQRAGHALWHWVGWSFRR